MTGFTFYKSFYETIKKIRNPRDRANAIMAICEYMFEDKEPDANVSETVEIVFQSVRHTLDKSKKNGANGSETKPKRTKNKTETNDNRNEIELQSNDNRNEIELKTRLSSSLSSSSNTPLFISPQSGDEKTDFSDDFFELYPRYAKDRAKMRADVDYKRLIEEFGKSQYLRNLYTVKQINELYPCIISGEFRDKEPKKDIAEEGREMLAARERFYAARRFAAEKKVEGVHKRFMQDEEFAKIERRLKAIPIEQAKAELKGDTKTLARLEQEQARLTLQRQGIIERNGMSEDNLLPKWHCSKCQDTGWIDGRLCDCYEKEKG